MTRHGKNYRDCVKLVDETRFHKIDEAIEIAKKAKFAKFDETVELHFRMGVDPRHADQQVRGVALLPHGLGKVVRVLVFTQGEGIKLAEDAGADFVGGDDLIKKIEGGWLDFDIALATPDMMAKVGKLGKLLGRRGLMPNPKSGTIAPAADLPRVIRDARKGRVEFKLDKTALIHVAVGKVSFENQSLIENIQAVVEAIVKAKPSGAKGTYVRTMTLATSMGPGIKLDTSAAIALSTGA